MTKIKLQFAKYHDVTGIAKEVNSEYNHIEKVFICPDTHTYWIARIIKGVNYEYEKKEGSFILEREDIEKERGEQITTLEQLKSILRNATFDNWNVEDIKSIEQGIDILDGGFGIAKIENLPAE